MRSLKEFTPRSLKICAPIQYSLRSGAKPSLIFGLHRVKALLLKHIRLQFVDQTDAAAFLAHVEDDATAFRLHLAHRGLELFSAVTAHGTEHISGEALGMHAAEHILAVPRYHLSQEPHGARR